MKHAASHGGKQIFKSKVGGPPQFQERIQYHRNCVNLLYYNLERLHMPHAQERVMSLAASVNAQADIHDTLPRLDEEADMFIELRAVLEKYNCLQKYGITLLHKHFDLKDDEILVEYTDMENRVLTTAPVKLDTVQDNNFYETTWSLQSGATLLACYMVCYKNSTTGQHYTWEHRK